MEPYLTDDFLDRVRRAYCLALDADVRTPGRIWQAIDARRSDVHDALVAEGNAALRAVFADPIATDLYYGTDGLCRSEMTSNNGRPFLALALESYRAELAKHQLRSVTAALASVAGQSIVEIGPGVGHCAFFAHGADIDYTTIDLPLGMVAQACFLGRAAGPEQIWMDGDAVSPRRDQIKLFSVAKLPDRQFSVALNVDSLTEMSLPAALDYADWISEHAQIFISINHEKNPFRVVDVAWARIGIAKSARSAWPPREGYFEESFFIGAPPNMATRRLRSRWLRGKTLSRRALNAARRRLVLRRGAGN